jgi:geranylgeranyl pyrophosphate synthase
MAQTEMKTDFRQWLVDQNSAIQEQLQGAMQRFATDGVPTRLRQAMEHALLGGGKCVRPALVLLACEASGGAQEQAWPAAVSVEMIHSYSLVHDDLPCMDDDLLRRGRPTVHAAFDEATAVLAGDALQCIAFEVIAHQSDARLAAAQSRILSAASGPVGMVGGQALDMELEGRGSEATLEQVEQVHRGKTAALLAGSLLLGAEVCNASQAWQKYALAVGRLFQATDDLLDTTGTTEELGKTAGKDEAAQKATLVAVLGLEGAKAYARQLANEARTAVDQLPIGSHQAALLSLPDFLLDRCH